MLIEPLPGASRHQIAQAIGEVFTNLTNLRSAGNRRDAYIDWANTSAEKLGLLISSGDVERLVLTKRYWVLQSMETGLQGGHQRLLNTELDQQCRLFETTERALKQEIQRWSRRDGAGAFVVPDTSFYFRYNKLEEIHLAAPVGCSASNLWDGLGRSPADAIRVIVPILVIDELDRLKESKDKHVRWRAAYTLAVIDRVLQARRPVASLIPEEFSLIGGTRRGEVTLEILFDPPGHARLPIDDDEIVDRARAVHAFIGEPVTVITYDTGQSMRARETGLVALKLSENLGDEPVVVRP